MLKPYDTHNWERISEKEWEVVRPVEKELETSPWLIHWDNCVYGCNYCEYSALLPRMEGHLKQRSVYYVARVDVVIGVLIHAP